MRAFLVRNVAALFVVGTSQAIAQQPTGGAAPQQGGAAPGAQTPQGPGAGRGGNTRPRPYNQVITDRAKSDQGGVTVHQVEDRYYFEVPDSLVGRDFLLVGRIAGGPPPTRSKLR